MTGPILVLARNGQQCEEWRQSIGLPPGSVREVITSRAVRDVTKAVLVRLPGWDMRPYREVAPVIAELLRVDLVRELGCNDHQAFALWREQVAG